jgi:hypothetical protein
MTEPLTEWVMVRTEPLGGWGRAATRDSSEVAFSAAEVQKVGLVVLMNATRGDFAAEVKGSLPDDILAMLDFDRLQPLMHEVLLGQRHTLRTPLLKRGTLTFGMTPFDEGGYTTVYFNEPDYPKVELLRLHYTRLLPGPLGLEDLQEVLEEE